ncbi:hypothetical protein N9481_04005 [Pelagibacteraceae bacterium]|nr:hypothetical protein [Pelagibacteraceae bacterium]
MQSHAPLGTDWLPWHFQRIYNFSEYLKLNGYFSNYGFSIWSICKDCSLDAGYEENKIYLSLYIFSNLPYVIINHYFGVENLKLYGHLVDKITIFITGILIAELLIKLQKNKNEMRNFIKAILCFIFFIINPWTYKMIIANWSIIFFVVFYLSGILMFLNNKQNIGLLLFFISGLFSYQSSAGVGLFYTMILIILYTKKRQNLIKSYFPNVVDSKLLPCKIIFSLFASVLFYFFLKFLATSGLEGHGGSSILERIGISGNDTHNGGLLGTLQFLGGNRITQCIVGSNMGLDVNNLSRSIFLYNCILSTISMFLISLISIFGLFIFYKKHNSFFKLITFPVLFLLLSYLLLLQQSSSAHLMGYSYFFSAIFSVGITAIIFRVLEKYNFSAIAITLSTPITIGIILLCIRVSMLTGING